MVRSHNNRKKKAASNLKRAHEKPPIAVSTLSIRWRPLKLVYDRDIRLAQMPVNCSFRVLRDVVSKRFPMLKSALVKYKDSDGDLVTITCTAELRSVESWVDGLLPKVPDSVGTLRLHIVEVNPEQEPALLEEEEDKPAESEESKDGHSGSDLDNESNKVEEEGTAAENPECKEVEMDDWLFQFAQLFRSHVGIDRNNLHELAMEIWSKSVEKTVTNEEAQALFDKGALKFKQMAALAFFSWGNVNMWEAKKQIPMDDSASDEMMVSQPQSAYDWRKGKYSLARRKYEEALSIKPDFYDGLLALGQQQFDMAKLNWSFVMDKKEELSKWDPAETLVLFGSAEKYMKEAKEMLEKLEEQRANELKDPNGPETKASADEAADQAAVLSQIHLFWGYTLFERSQVEFKLGLGNWKTNLHTAVEQFKLAGASKIDISKFVNNHCSNEEAAGAGSKQTVES